MSAPSCLRALVSLHPCVPAPRGASAWVACVRCQSSWSLRPVVGAASSCHVRGICRRVCEACVRVLPWCRVRRQVLRRHAVAATGRRHRVRGPAAPVRPVLLHGGDVIRAAAGAALPVQPLRGAGVCSSRGDGPGHDPPRCHSAGGPRRLHLSRPHVYVPLGSVDPWLWSTWAMRMGVRFRGSVLAVKMTSP